MIAAVIGAAVVLAICTGGGCGYWVATRRLRRTINLQQGRLELKEKVVEELRHELVEDKKVNRKLRYQLARQGHAESEGDYQELEEALQAIQALRVDLDEAKEKIGERDASLRVARLAIQEIRAQIEGSSSLKVNLRKERLERTQPVAAKANIVSLEDVATELDIGPKA